MRNFVILSVVMFVVLTGCVTMPSTNNLKEENLELRQQLQDMKNPQELDQGEGEVLQVKLGKSRTMKNIVDNLLKCVGSNCGQIIDTQIVAGRTRSGDEFSQETWLIEDTQGHMHLVYIENGIIENIKPYEGEMKRSRFKPVTAK